jgi:hypothetical protein
MQWLPLMTEITMRGLWGRLCAIFTVRTIYLLVCTGQMCALAWTPPHILGWIFFLITTEVIEETIPYKPKRDRLVQGSWLLSNVPTAFTGMAFCKQRGPTPAGHALDPAVTLSRWHARLARHKAVDWLVVSNLWSSPAYLQARSTKPTHLILIRSILPLTTAPLAH